MSKHREDQSLGADDTYQSSKESNSNHQSLGEQSTFGGSQASLFAPLESGSLLNDGDLEIVDLSNRYTIERILGQGGMGRVLLATDTRLRRKVAIKRILAPSRSAIQRFLPEAQSVASLNHFNIVQVYDYGQDKEGPFLVMEYVDGQSLQERLKNSPIGVSEAIDLVCQLCDGLTKAHAAGIIHRDIKPANILLASDGTPKLTDFGLAKQESADHGQTVTGAVLGTFDYMSPEQRRDSSKVDARTDLWSLAATLYTLVTGKNPKVIRLDQLPKALQIAVGKALEENPADRFASASEFRTSLQQAKRGLNSNAALLQLQTGECPSCGVQNELSRKFCSNCATRLETPCLSCGQAIRVWEDVCGECGTRQSELIETEQQAIDEALQRSLSLEHEYRLDEALVCLTGLKRLNHATLIEGYQKLDARSASIEKLRSEWDERRKLILVDARASTEAAQWSEAIRAIESLPEPLRDPLCKEELSRARQCLTRIAPLRRAGAH